jgi:hypothetical protein
MRPERTPQQLAQDAWDAHAELVKLEVVNPRLKANEHWRALRDTAFARYRAALEAA